MATEQATAGADRSRPVVRRPVRVTRVAVDDGGEDADLAAYNRYLSWLNANPGAKPERLPRLSRPGRTDDKCALPSPATE